MDEAFEQCLAMATPSLRRHTLSELARPAAAVLEGASMVGAAEVLEDAVAVLCRGDEDLVDGAILVVRAAAARGWHSPGTDAVARHCAEALESRLARSPRAAGDWSLELPGGCGCNLCQRLGDFMADPVQELLEWPLAKDGRAHLHRRIDSAELPVLHKTRRVGRPYTLVLAKTQALFELEAEARRRDQSDLAWLTGLGSGKA